MSVDKFNLTISRPVDASYLKEAGGAISEDKSQAMTRRRLYKYFCKLDRAEVMWEPHKFLGEANYRIPYCKIDVNPKYFNSFNELHSYLNSIFGIDEIDLAEFNISRLDVKSDIENLPIDVALSRLYAMGFRRESVSLYKGSTIYIGTNPKIRI